ncbi:MAG: hypothetical protein U0136_13935 [Bdellovibrionota bacterium]
MRHSTTSGTSSQVEVRVGEYEIIIHVLYGRKLCGLLLSLPDREQPRFFSLTRSMEITARDRLKGAGMPFPATTEALLFSFESQMFDLRGGVSVGFQDLRLLPPTVDDIDGSTNCIELEIKYGDERLAIRLYGNDKDADSTPRLAIGDPRSPEMQA